MVRRRERDRSYGSSLSEFGPALWVFLIFIVIPLLDLVSFGSGVGTVMLMSNWASRQAAACNTFTEAKQSVAQTEDQLKSFRKFAAMTPTNGTPSGVSIKVVVTPLNGSGGQSFDDPGNIPNKPPRNQVNPNDPPMNTMNCVYQYVVTSSYDVAPLFNFSGTPFLRDVPALGKAVPVVFTTTASVEHPDGLNQ